MQIKKRLSMLPRETHRALDVLDVYRATTTLIELFTLISSLSDSYPLANALAKNTRKVTIPQVVDPSLTYQTRMIFLQVQTLPGRLNGSQLIYSCAVHPTGGKILGEAHFIPLRL